MYEMLKMCSKSNAEGQSEKYLVAETPGIIFVVEFYLCLLKISFFF